MTLPKVLRRGMAFALALTGLFAFHESATAGLLRVGRPLPCCPICPDVPFGYHRTRWLPWPGHQPAWAGPGQPVSAPPQTGVPISLPAGSQPGAVEVPPALPMK